MGSIIKIIKIVSISVIKMEIRSALYKKETKKEQKTKSFNKTKRKKNYLGTVMDSGAPLQLC